MTRSLYFRLFLILALMGIVFSGCSRDPNVRKQKYFESGQRYFERGKYREAAIQYSNAVQVDPRFTDAHYQLAQTYLKLQEWTRAYQELSRTIELQPDNYQAHIDIANLLIAGHDLKQAQEHTDLLLAKQPNNPQVHESVANLLAGQGNLAAAIQEMRKTIDLGPDRWEAYLNQSGRGSGKELPEGGRSESAGDECPACAGQLLPVPQSPGRCRKAVPARD